MDALNPLLSSIFSSQVRVFLIVCVLLLLASEIGFRRGLGLFRRKDDARKGHVGAAQASILGMLALLLGFTFSFAAGRYQERQHLVLDEANAIRTTYLSTSFLPDDHREAVQATLRQYLDARIGFFIAGNDPEKIASAEKDTAQLQNDLWMHTVAASKESPSPLFGSFVGSLTKTFDLNATHLNMYRWHVPGTVWLLVLIVAITGCYATGYGAGASGARSVFPSIILPLLITVIITLIADLDRPRAGLISISQQPLLDVKASLSSP